MPNDSAPRDSAAVSAPYRVLARKYRPSDFAGLIGQEALVRTRVNDIRELIEGVRYRPVSARFKIYIIDEVHMLSSSAFNALLKTLEEPPEHVKFIFATTEIRKVPVTVLSRCQRFDLRRIEADKLAAHLGSIVASEGAKLATT